MKKWIPVVVAVILIVAGVAQAGPEVAGPTGAGTVKAPPSVQSSKPSMPPEVQKVFGPEADVQVIEVLPPGASGDVGAKFICYSSPAITTQNGVAGGKAKVSVYCAAGMRYHVVMDMHIEARPLLAGSAWVVADGSGQKECTLGPIVPLVCTLNFDFPATSVLSTRQFRLAGTILVNGSGGIPVAEGHSWVFNRNGMPYPKERYLRRETVPFPSYNGPWDGGDPRDQDRFVRECKDWYRSSGWPLPTSDSEVRYHHVHPLGWGGRNVGTNCYILAIDQHDRYTGWWNGFRP